MSSVSRLTFILLHKYVEFNTLRSSVKESKFDKALFFDLFSLNTSLIMSYIVIHISPTRSPSTIHVNPPTWQIGCSVISHLENCISLLLEPMELPSDSCSESRMLLPACIQPSSSAFDMLALCCWFHSARASVDGLKDSEGELPTSKPWSNVTSRPELCTLPLGV